MQLLNLKNKIMKVATITKVPTPIVHTYKEIKIGKFETVRHYELDNIENGTTQLSTNIKISINRHFNNSKVDYLVHQRTSNKWDKMSTTGLFSFGSDEVIYYGDIANNKVKKHTLVFKYSKDKQTLIIYYFKDFYTPKIDLLINQLG